MFLHLLQSFNINYLNGYQYVENVAKGYRNAGASNSLTGDTLLTDENFGGKLAQKLRFFVLDWNFIPDNLNHPDFDSITLTNSMFNDRTEVWDYDYDQPNSISHQYQSPGITHIKVVVYSLIENNSTARVQPTHHSRLPPTCHHQDDMKAQFIETLNHTIIHATRHKPAGPLYNQELNVFIKKEDHKHCLIRLNASMSRHPVNIHTVSSILYTTKDTTSMHDDTKVVSVPSLELS